MREGFYKISWIVHNTFWIGKNIISIIHDGGSICLDLDWDKGDDFLLVKLTNGFCIVRDISHSISFFKRSLLLFILQFALPHILGWGRLTNQLPGGIEGQPSKVDSHLLDLEWDK